MKEQENAVDEKNFKNTGTQDNVSRETLNINML